MNRLFLPGFKLWILTFSFSLGLFSSLCIAQPSNDADPDICKQLAIESAQLANQSYAYAQKSYFSPSSAIPDKNVDTALIFIQESIFLIDSAIILASDSSVLAIKYANIAKNYAIDSYHDLIHHQNNPNKYQKSDLSKSAAFNSANATVEAYKASFYFKCKKKTAPPPIAVPDKQITKLDIDQTLFTLLKEDLQQKKEINAQEILKLSEELSKTKEPAKQSELKAQLEKLKLKEKEFNKKSEDTQHKLTTINTLIEERDKAPTTYLGNEETVFSRSIVNTTDEWNNQVKLDVELPAGLVYQVQLGVYKKPIVPKLFKGLTPIYAKTTERGISYSTGLFEKLADAKEAKNYVIQMGFTDAFIVAYNSKKKIPLNDAVKLEK